MMQAIRLTCPECGAAFTRTHHLQRFCTSAHKVAFNNRELARGKSMVSLAQAWRAARGSKDPADREAARAAFAKLCRLVDAANTEDRLAGRANALRLYRRREAL